MVVFCTAWPPTRGEDDEEEEGEINEEDGDDDDDDPCSSRHSYEGIEISIDHANLYEWLHKWTKEYGIPAVTPMGVFECSTPYASMAPWTSG